MNNSSIEHKIAPWQTKGRWYHAFIESDGSAEKITISDLDDCSIAGNSFVLPAGYNLVDVKYVDVDLAGSKTLATYGKATTSAHHDYFKLPAAADFTYCDVYFFAYFKEV